MLRWNHAVMLALHLSLITGLLLAAQSRLGVAAALLLFLPLPGLLRGRAYTAAWASMGLAFYSALLLAEGYANPAQRTLAFALASLAAADFVALILFVRITSRLLTLKSGRASSAQTAG
jgi:uncharacterized membrane protein